MNSTVEAMVTIAGMVVGVAIIATLVSTKANTGGVLQSFGAMMSNMLSAATSPVTGTGTAPVNQVQSGTNTGFMQSFQLPASPMIG